MLEAVNKKDGVFTEADEQTLQALAEFCGLLVICCRMREDFASTDNQLKVQSVAHMVKVIIVRNFKNLGCSRDPCLSQTMHQGTPSGGQSDKAVHKGGAVGSKVHNMIILCKHTKYT